MRILAVVSLACLFTHPAAAITCEQVRGYVQAYGMQAVMAYVKSAGISAEEVQRGRACLRRDAGRHRKQFGRLSSSSWGSN